jgi:hypothetical protein
MYVILPLASTSAILALQIPTAFPAITVLKVVAYKTAHKIRTVLPSNHALPPMENVRQLPAQMKMIA